MKKRIAIIGGGVSGLSLAYFLSNKNYSIDIYEKQNILGGISSCFKKKDWQWGLERHYHHFFNTDKEFISLLNELDIKIDYKKPITASLFEKKLFLKIDTIFDFFKIPFLNFFEKIRMGFVLFFFKITPRLKIYETSFLREFGIKYIGKKGWFSLWENLLRKKFGKYAGNILTVFLWSRIKVRNNLLGYVNGSLDIFFLKISKVLEGRGVGLFLNEKIEKITKKKEFFIIRNKQYDKVVFTIPTMKICKIAKNILSKKEISSFKKNRYLSSQTIVLLMNKKVLEKVYWLNINDSKIPLTVLIQHTNFINKKYYGDLEVLYMGNYLLKTDRRFFMDEKTLLKKSLDTIFKINKDIKFTDIQDFFIFNEQDSQPVYNSSFIKNKPKFLTSNKNVFICNLDLTYPYDRGVNYAVKRAKELSKIIC